MSSLILYCVLNGSKGNIALNLSRCFGREVDNIYISLKAYLPEDAEVFVGEALSRATEILKNSAFS